MDLAFALGFPSADRLLHSISTSDWLEWVEWAKIRGAVGPDRWDYYVKLLALHSSRGTWPEGKAPTLADLRMPWDPEPAEATTKPADGERPRGPIFIPPSARRSRTPV